VECKFETPETGKVEAKDAGGAMLYNELVVFLVRLLSRIYVGDFRRGTDW
jgi:hypothetical protein